MSIQLKQFLNRYASFEATELDEIVSEFIYRTVHKNEFLLMEGNTCKDLAFVQSGCLRLYYISQGVEISVWFAFQETSAIEIYSFISERPSKYFIQAIEESTVLVLPKKQLLNLYKTYPKMQEIMRKFWEDVILNLLERFTALQSDTAEQRYLDLLAKPAYLQQIPQKFLASFIGVTPTSLSPSQWLGSAESRLSVRHLAM